LTEPCLTRGKPVEFLARDERDILERLIRGAANVFARLGVNDRTIRLNVGLHDARSIIAGLEQAFVAAAK
jgi:cystathionine beta-lyase/cystathionine gamma-synthase